jgi:antitoxin (DNA-binding transcriptional repressor) of toxin-antitoxin stability system
VSASSDGGGAKHLEARMGVGRGLIAILTCVPAAFALAGCDASNDQTQTRLSNLSSGVFLGQIVDEAAAGERIVIERAGQPIAAIVPLADLALVDPERRKADRLRALDDIRRLARERPFRLNEDATTLIRRMRDERTAQIARNIRDATK